MVFSCGAPAIPQPGAVSIFLSMDGGASWLPCKQQLQVTSALGPAPLSLGPAAWLTAGQIGLWHGRSIDGNTSPGLPPVLPDLDYPSNTTEPICILSVVKLVEDHMAARVILNQQVQR